MPRMTPSRSNAIVQQPGAQSYARFLAGVKERIHTAQVKVALAANAELVLHYWEIGRDILANQARRGWGAKVIDRPVIHVPAFSAFSFWHSLNHSVVNSLNDFVTQSSVR